MYIHSGPLSKGQRRGGNTVYRPSGPLSKGQRGGGRQCTDTQTSSKGQNRRGNSVETHRTST